MMNYRKSFLAFGVLVASQLGIFQAVQADTGFCAQKFGLGANIRFTPDSANAIGVADTVWGSAERLKNPDAEQPTAFKCRYELSRGNKPNGKIKGNCKEGLKPVRWKDRVYCDSATFQLKELCPTELKQYWPEILDKTCQPQTKSASGK